jgi:hypothetical protein
MSLTCPARLNLIGIELYSVLLTAQPADCDKEYAV